MGPAAVLAIGAESALGSGRNAYRVGAPGERPRIAIARDAVLEGAGLKKPFMARASLPGTDGDRAAHLLTASARALVLELDVLLPDWKARKVGMSIGTSSGGMLPLTEAFGRRSRGEPLPRDLARASPYFGPLGALDAVLGTPLAARVQVLSACASSAVALGVAARWLEHGVCDVVVAGGYDAVSVFVAAGFECIGATSASPPNPFRVQRDGMALGEAAVLFALVRPVDAPRALFFLRGFGATCDAVHVTAPDRTGDGLARAARAALLDAGLPASAVDLVSAHATATPFNDAAEAKALSAVIDTQPSDAVGRAFEPVVHPFKAVVGHTLGASAALELAAAFDAMETGTLPAAAGAGDVMPELTARLLSENAAGNPRTCLKLSAAFAGSNAALVASYDPSTRVDGSARRAPRATHGVALRAFGQPRTAADVARLAGLTRLPLVQLSRLDALSAACIAAAYSVIDDVQGISPERVGVIVGSAASVIENNEVFDARLRHEGVPGVEPRRFPATSPNVPAGQCAIAFGLRGPAFAVGGGPEAPFEALLVAWDLLSHGDADALVVVAAEHVGPTVTDLWAAAGYPLPEDGAVAALLVRDPSAQGLEREALVNFWRLARAEAGRFRGRAPGWPAFQAALAP